MYVKQFYDFVDNFCGKYSDFIINVKSFYFLSNDKDELVWGVVWLYVVMKSNEYFVKVEKYYKEFGMNREVW